MLYSSLSSALRSSLDTKDTSQIVAGENMCLQRRCNVISSLFPLVSLPLGIRDTLYLIFQRNGEKEDPLRSSSNPRIPGYIQFRYQVPKVIVV